MGLFDQFFRKKSTTAISQQAAESVQLQKDDTFISTAESLGLTIVRALTDEQKGKIDTSTLLLRTGQLYMHYWTDHLVCTDRNDPEWQNKVMFFWKAEEPFPKKSLPPAFETFKTRHFLFTGDTSKISLQVGQAMPWFGMPGLGAKHVCELNGKKVTVPELEESGLVEYIERVELTADNSDILTKREDYFFLIDDSITPFKNGHFYFKGKPISIDLAYGIGGIHIVKKAGLNLTE